MNDDWGRERLMSEYLCGGVPRRTSGQGGSVDCVDLNTLAAAEKHAVPTLYIFGSRDESYSPAHAVRLSKRLDELGVPSFALVVPMGRHGGDRIRSSPMGQLSSFALESFFATFSGVGQTAARAGRAEHQGQAAEL
uniref:Peptidase S9 prolyl oligopeptidase catalytic domain-containing protein n=1 Tax=Alexandrium catenella TaxID=2925 RepID=A0A7S1MCY3_ALECA|mmetsp:Transcript_24277/g.66208  ORF Transcript_24277/g.66208 Transcript_24277/m.66208 type:complete len:136 (+) Transcript_24277:3-410(+)